MKKEISNIDLLNELKTAKKELYCAECNYNTVKNKLEKLILLEFPIESVVRLVRDSYDPYHYYQDVYAKINPSIGGDYRVGLYDEFGYMGIKDVSEEELLEFLNNNSKWLKKKRSEEKNLKLEEKKLQKEKEYQEYLKLKSKFEKRRK